MYVPLGVVTVEAPDLATRRAILKSKAELRGIDIPDAVLDYIAEHLRSSVRELEDTYFRWLTRTDDQLRAALDAYDVAAAGGR